MCGTLEDGSSGICVYACNAEKTNAYQGLEQHCRKERCGWIVGKVVDSQHDRFKEAARELGADESDDALDRIMGKLDLKKKPEPEKPAKK